MTATARQRAEYVPNGVRLVADLWAGRRDADAVILAHGGGQTRYSWGRTAERLAAHGYTVINYDARGHGDSDWDPAGNYTLDAFAADLLGVIETCDRPPVLVGASLGGTAALVVAGEHPDAAKAIVLVDVVVEVERVGVSRIRNFMRANASDGFASLEEVADAVARYNPLRRRPLNLDGMRKNVRQHENGRWYWHWDPVFLSDDDETRSLHRTDRLRDAARRVTVPTLVVRGGESDVVSETGLANMLALMPGAESIDVAAAGHMVAGDDNDVFATGLMTFLSRIDHK